MKTKLTILIMVVTIMGTVAVNGQTTSSPVTDLMLNSISERGGYTTEPVSDQQLDIILKCGVKAPSSNNQQPWRFTVIKDEATVKEIVKDAVAGNVLIIVSGPEAQVQNPGSGFDNGLAVQNMFLAAHGLGLGARIYGSPARTINYNLETYQVPTGYRAIVVLRVGNIAKGPDAVSSASPRKDFNEIVNFKK
jgi:nitroreductase